MGMVPSLTQRELEIVACIFDGKTSKAIAQSEYQHPRGKETPREPDELDRRSFGTATSAIPGITGIMPKRSPSRS
jgi:hypothetical protein